MSDEAKTKGEMILERLEDFLFWHAEVHAERKAREERRCTSIERDSDPPMSDNEENMNRSREDFVGLLDALARES